MEETNEKVTAFMRSDSKSVSKIKELRMEKTQKIKMKKLKGKEPRKEMDGLDKRIGIIYIVLLFSLRDDIITTLDWRSRLNINNINDMFSKVKKIYVGMSEDIEVHDRMGRSLHKKMDENWDEYEYLAGVAAFSAAELSHFECIYGESTLIYELRKRLSDLVLNKKFSTPIADDEE